jgi:hypothetical protein
MHVLFPSHRYSQDDRVNTGTLGRITAPRLICADVGETQVSTRTVIAGAAMIPVGRTP